MSLPPPALRLLPLPELLKRPSGGNILVRRHDAKDHPVDFEAFVFVVLTFCLLSPGEVRRFVFDVVDLDASGELDLTEIEYLIEAVNNGEAQFGRYVKSNRTVLTVYDKYVNGQGRS